jgi:transcriptional regulator with XRE-family HTH domain
LTTLSKVNGAILKWGRERAHLSKDAVAKSIGASAAEIDNWEKSNSQLTLKKALDLAKTVRIPFGYLYLSSPPKDTLPIPDLRRRGDFVPPKPSVNFTDVINEVILKQQWFRAFRIEEGAKKLPFVGKYIIEADPDLVAKDIRDTLGLDAEVHHAGLRCHFDVRCLPLDLSLLHPPWALDAKDRMYRNQPAPARLARS